MHSKIKHIAIFILLSVVFLVAGIAPSYAAGIVPPSDTGNYSLNDFAILFVNISKWILGIVGSLTLLMFIYGGVTLIFSAGNNETVSKGKQIIFNSIMGLIIVFTSYIIVQFAASALLPGEPNIFKSGWFKNN